MNILDILYAQDGISSVGVCEFAILKKYMSAISIQQTYEKCENPQSIFVALFPYFCGYTNGNLSIYARGVDYHKVINNTLSPVAQYIKSEMGANAVVLVDNSPLAEVQSARLAGVGKIGENGLIFDSVYGSYVFIGTILTDIPFKKTPAICSGKINENLPDEDSDIIDCLGCGLCKKHCKANAIGENGKILCESCISDLTQSKKELTNEQKQMLLKHDLIWGCDTCQKICPQNRNVPHTENPLFTQNLINSLDREDLIGLTRKQFNEKYTDRAFTWRGTKPILRNLTLKGNDK